MIFDFKYDSVYGIRESKFLDGAISSKTNFIELLGVKNIEEINDSYRLVGIEKLVTNDFIKDKEHDIFVNSHGAVANAFDFRKLGVLEEREAIRRIIAEYRDKYPRYDFEISPSKFPINVDRKETIMSTHVLYIKNYPNFYKKPKLLVKK